MKVIVERSKGPVRELGQPFRKEIVKPSSQPTFRSWWWTHLMAPKIHMRTYKLSKLRCTSVRGVMPLAVNFSLVL
ncbi:hypothetical protein CR513_09999, partial [Mucuna pruriens]